MKNYNSLSTIAFTVHHDHPETLTPNEITDGLFQRIADILRTGEWTDAASPPEDTLENKAQDWVHGALGITRSK